MDENFTPNNVPENAPAPQSYIPQPPVNNGGNGMAIAALVLGIVGIVLFWVPWFNIVVLALSIVGVILGAKALKKTPVGAPGRGLAMAGLILSIIGLVFVGIGFLTCTVCTACTAAAIASGAGSAADWNELAEQLENLSCFLVH